MKSCVILSSEMTLTIVSGVDCGGWDWGDLARVVGGAAMIKIHCMKKTHFQ